MSKKIKLRIIADSSLELHKCRVLEPDDWDERPENICVGCGYELRSCTGKFPKCVNYVPPSS